MQASFTYIRPFRCDRECIACAVGEHGVRSDGWCADARRVAGLCSSPRLATPPRVTRDVDVDNLALGGDIVRVKSSPSPESFVRNAPFVKGLAIVGRPSRSVGPIGGGRHSSGSLAFLSGLPNSTAPLPVPVALPSPDRGETKTTDRQGAATCRAARTCPPEITSVPAF
jgi:hypothetical protein